MQRLPRWVLLTAIVVVMAVGVASSAAVGTARRPFPKVSGEVDLAGLTAPVEVRRDGYGVPHLYADNAEDLFAAQGYVHAQDRFWEMDIRRHITAGRLSELFGPDQLETDFFVRTLGWRRVAEQELIRVSPSTRRYLDAYATGVNAYLRERPPAGLSLEYSVLGAGYTPEPWSAVDSLAWLKAMAWDLGHNREQETERALATAAVGEQLAADLYPAYPLEGVEPILGRGDVRRGAFDPDAAPGDRRPAPVAGGVVPAEVVETLTAANRLGSALDGWVGSDADDRQSGSNSFALSGSRTASGKAVLGNDPHVATSIPSLFVQGGLHCRTVSALCPFDVSGFGLAGLPGVVIGRNTQIAWGLTTSHADVQDLYLEQLRGNTVRAGAEYQPLTVRTEQVRVAGEEEPRTLTIRASRHGPLISDVHAQLKGIAGRRGPAYAIALRWVGLDPGRTMDSVFGLNQARTFEEFRAAARLLSAPSQNIVYADVRGNIGYQLPGALPRRGKGNGVGLSPGWDAAYDWKGMVPFAELPWAYNPPAGFIVAANQPVVGRRYPHRIGSTFSYGWRSQELVEAISEAGELTLDDAERLFYDDTVRFAATLVPTLLKIKVADPWVLEGQRTLVGWDYSAGADSAAAAYFNVVLHDLLKRTFRDQLPQELWPTGGDRWMAVVATLMKQPDNPWWDDTSTPGVVEDRDDMLLAAMTDARKELTSLTARDTDQWAWGKLHRVTLRHRTLGNSGVRPVEQLFNRGDLAVSGGPAAVNAMGYDTTKGYRVSHGPAMRMLVDLGDLNASRWVNQSGVSGHAFHRNYDDQLPIWAGSRMWPFLAGRTAVEAHTEHVLVLQPRG